MLYTVGAATLFAAGEANLTSILAATTTAWLLGVGFAWWLLLRQMPPGREPSKATPRKVLGFGARGIIGGFSAIDNVRLDQVVVGLSLNARSLGLYVAAIAFCNLPRFVAQSIGSVAFPRVPPATTPRRAWAQTARAIKIGTALISLCVAGLMLALPFLLPLLFGEEFQDAIPIGRILLLGACSSRSTACSMNWPGASGHPGYGSITELVNATVFLVGLAFFGTPPSLEGVASAVVAGGLASSSLLALLLIRLRSQRDDSQATDSPPTSGAP